jgi:hypothetical protein
MPITIGGGFALEETLFDFQRREFSTSMDPNYYVFMESGLNVEYNFSKRVQLGVGASYWYHQRIEDFKQEELLELQSFEQSNIRLQFQIQFVIK